MAALTASWSAVRLGPSNAADAAMMIAAVLALLVAVRHQVLSGLRPWMITIVLIAVLLVTRDVVLLGLPLGGSDLLRGIGSLPMLGRLLFSTIAPLILILIWSNLDRAWLPRLLSWWLAGAMASAFVALLQANGLFGEFSFLDYTVGTTSDRYPGLASHPNSLAQSAVLAIPVAAVRLINNRRGGLLFFIAAIVLFGSAILISGSRAGLLVGIVVLSGSFLVLMMRRGRWIWIPPIALLGIAVGIALGPALIGQTRLSAGAGVDSDVGRLNSIGRGFELFAASPFLGSGMGSWYGEFGPLILLASGGVVFLTAYLFFVGVPVLAMLRNRREPVIALLLVVVIAQIGFWILNNGLFERYTYWPMFIGYFLAIHVSSKQA